MPPLDIQSSSLYNPDLAPVPQDRRTWGTYNYAALWIGMSVCIPTYTLASGFIKGGMSWWQAIGTILLGNLIVLVPMLLNAHAGTRYGIPFPVFVRASFGVLGANIPAILRALVACGWFGIQCWIGGQAIYAMAKIVWPTFGNTSVAPWICFFFFWALNIIVILRGIETIKFLEGISAPFMLAIGLLLLWWMVSKAGGFGPVLSTPSTFHKSFIQALTGSVGFWATVALNIPDFTRYAKSQKAQVTGQAIGLPAGMTLFAFIAVAVTLASGIIFGQPIWEPVDLLAKFNQPVVAFIALIALLVATLNTNVAANVVSPSNDFSNLNPRRISFRMGGLITGIIGIAMMPWKLLSDPDSYISGWLVGYSGFLGPIAGIMIADYFIVRRAELNVRDLYLRGGQYEYQHGINIRAVVALVCGVAVALLGLVQPAVHWLYDDAWFVGFLVSGAVYVVLSRSSK